MQVSTKNKLKNFFRAFISLSYWINGFCLGFVIWQTIKCMTKYIEKPKGTEISMKSSTNLSFPAISVCGKFEKQKHGYDWGFNHTYLQNVCGIRYYIVVGVFFFYPQRDPVKRHHLLLEFGITGFLDNGQIETVLIQKNYLKQ